MMKKAEFSKAPPSIQFQSKENTIKSSRMMSLESQDSVMIKIDGSTLLRSKKTKLRATL